MIRDHLVEEKGFTDDARRYYCIATLDHQIFAAELSRIGNIVRAARPKARPKQPAHARQDEQDRQATRPVPLLLQDPRPVARETEESLRCESTPYLECAP